MANCVLPLATPLTSWEPKFCRGSVPGMCSRSSSLLVGLGMPLQLTLTESPACTLDGLSNTTGGCGFGVGTAVGLGGGGTTVGEAVTPSVGLGPRVALGTAVRVAVGGVPVTVGVIVRVGVAVGGVPVTVGVRV